MPDIIDYVTTVAPRTLAERPFDACDALALAGVCYNSPDPAARGAEGLTLRQAAERFRLSDQQETPLTPKRRALLEAMGPSARYGAMVLHDFMDVVVSEVPIQFSAVCCDLGDGTHAVAFRGTDNTLAGWHEDLAMSFESPVPAQDAACAYLEHAAAHMAGPLILCGHSKGGNLAAWAASHAPSALRDRIRAVYTFDSPGLDEATLSSPAYAEVRPRFRAYVPQGSVVGLMMGYEADYTILRSTALGLGQHDLFTWQLDDAGFETLSRTTLPSQLTDRTLHNVLRGCTPEDRRRFVDALFALLEATDMDTLHEMSQDKPRTVARILQAALALPPETRRVFLQMAGTFLSSGARGARDLLDEARETAPAQLKRILQAMPEADGEAMRARVQEAWRRASDYFGNHHEEENGHGE